MEIIKNLITYETMKAALVDMGELNSDIVSIAITGSKIFMSVEERLTDIDLIIITTGTSKNLIRKQIQEGEYNFDIWFFDINFHTEALKFKLNVHLLEYYNVLYNYYIYLYGGPHFEFDIFAHKEKYLEMIKNRIYNIAFTKTLKNAKTFLYKSFAAPYLVLKTFENNSTELTEEMINNVRRLYLQDNPNDILEWIGDHFGYVIAYKQE